ncbi:DUF1614 domain-containing protein [Desulfobacca acetoxidans]|uniref:DUF1614 domain-containing protein n=1 Tax=Desulfobacca acetoxidans (strain ATCC 700848 / DSM 11109 / ASRB2) TaxID=880072 RepID=F2NHP8_DESAR|nr:DUF1614 domain-containing protein [Desulfobacca acetoxidans]AEB09235.1 protein of unknown function DUF1614 [Desulfobacca acetoxidans DSM 11109]HAY23423.1 DUF1614 domain-containing protein [Desulfobacterales bacterium]
MFFPPLLLFFIIIFFFLIIFLFAFLQVGLIGIAFSKLGLPPEYLFGILLLTLLGSFINIPIGEMEGGEVVDSKEVRYFGVRYRLPQIYRRQKTVLAINLGGALMPLLISVYLLYKMSDIIPAFAATLIVTVVVSRLARPIRGVGIGIPALIPPLVAALAAYLLAAPEYRAPVAYISGTLGTLIGADLLRLKDIRNMGAPVASIGGAGTFDGVFLSGVIAVLLS